MTTDDFPPLLTVTRENPPFWKSILLIGAAVLCFVAGIFGWLLPVVTGVPFYIAGFILLGTASPRVRRWINRTEARLSPTWRRRIRAGIRRIPFKQVRDRVVKPSSHPSD